MTRIFLTGGYYIDTSDVEASEVTSWINSGNSRPFLDIHGNEACVNAEHITTAITNKEAGE